jgi:HTH-type transcriptional regulator, sugar sensing transcriptional regulator
MGESSAVERLTELGFSQYEARAYVGLLSSEPLTGYALSNVTGIPQPKVYETLRRLARRGAAVALSGEPVRFVALPPSQLLSQLDVSFRRRLADAEVGLMREFGAPTQDTRVFSSLNDWSSIEGAAIDLLLHANRHAYVSINCEDPDTLVSHIAQADRRGVTLDVLNFGKTSIQVTNGRSIRHASTDGVVYRHHQARHLAIVADSTHTLWALARDGGEWSSMAGDDDLLSSAIKGYVRHDIYVQQIVQDFGQQLDERYGPGLGKLVLPAAESAPGVSSEGKALRSA